ncbi:MAG TPA: hypothetical protein VGM66_10505 [Candidatus Udaeobacter sp.]
MDEQYTEAFQLVLEEARKIAGISATKRADLYEEFKAKVYELLQRHPRARQGRGRVFVLATRQGSATAVVQKA